MRRPASSRRSDRRVVTAAARSWWRRGRTALAAGVALVCLACSIAPAAASQLRSTPASSPTFPSPPAGRQAAWFFGAVSKHPIPSAEISAHFDRSYLATLPSPAAATLNAGFADVRRLLLDQVTRHTADSIAFVVTVNGETKVLVDLSVDAHALISSLHLGPTSPSASTTTTAPPAVPGVRQIAVGVGSPPLRGTLTLPRGKGPFPAVVLVSGSGPNDEDETVGPNHPFLDLAVGLARDGIATLRYGKRTLDYPRSIDARTFTPTDEYVPDALGAISLLRKRQAIDPRLIFVLGHSQGGTYAPLIAEHAPEVAGVVLLAAGTESLAHALLRQTRYLATLPGAIGASAKAQLGEVTAIAGQIGNLKTLEKLSSSTILFGGAGPAYYESGLRYNEVVTARAIRQPLLILQGDRDYQVTVKDDLDVWLSGLKGRRHVSVVQFPDADHLFLDGTGAPTPAEYERPSHVDPKVIAAIASWVERIGKDKSNS